MKCCQLSQSIIRICPSHHKKIQTLEVYGTRHITGINMKPTNFTFRLSVNLVCSSQAQVPDHLSAFRKKASCVILLKFSICVPEESQSYRFGIKRERVNGDIFGWTSPLTCTEPKMFLSDTCIFQHSCCLLSTRTEFIQSHPNLNKRDKHALAPANDCLPQRDRVHFCRDWCCWREPKQY